MGGKSTFSIFFPKKNIFQLVNIFEIALFSGKLFSVFFFRKSTLRIIIAITVIIFIVIKFIVIIIVIIAIIKIIVLVVTVIVIVAVTVGAGYNSSDKQLKFVRALN